MYTIGQLCKEFHLARGTLLYYDSIGLLKPSVRETNNYRRYSQEDRNRLRRICSYRETGMPLIEIGRILDAPRDNREQILEKHLDELTESIRKLEIQRRIIARMLQTRTVSNPAPTGFNINKAALNKAALVTVLGKTGLNDADLERLHQEFERLFPDEHQAFLEFLGFPPEEIKQIRKHAKT